MRIFLRSRGNPDSRKEVIISPKMVKAGQRLKLRHASLQGYGGAAGDSEAARTLLASGHGFVLFRRLERLF